MDLAMEEGVSSVGVSSKDERESVVGNGNSGEGTGVKDAGTSGGAEGKGAVKSSRVSSKGSHLGGVKTTPVRTVEAGPFVMEVWVEEGKEKMEIPEEQLTQETSQTSDGFMG